MEGCAPGAPLPLYGAAQCLKAYFCWGKIWETCVQSTREIAYYIYIYIYNICVCGVCVCVYKILILFQYMQGKAFKPPGAICQGKHSHNLYPADVHSFGCHLPIYCQVALPAPCYMQVPLAPKRHMQQHEKYSKTTITDIVSKDAI